MNNDIKPSITLVNLERIIELLKTYSASIEGSNHPGPNKQRSECGFLSEVDTFWESGRRRDYDDIGFFLGKATVNQLPSGL